MSHCINIESTDFKNLLEVTELNPELLKAIVSVWQERNMDLETLPSKKEVFSMLDTLISEEDYNKEGFINVNSTKGLEIYKDYNLLNSRGEIKTINPQDEEIINWVSTLNNSPYYSFHIRTTKEGSKIFVKNKPKYRESRQLNSNLKTITSQHLSEMKDKIKSQFSLDVVISDVLVDNKSNRIKGKIENGIVYLSREATVDTPIHEVLHPFIELIKQNNKALYKNLVRQLYETKEGRSILKTVSENYDAKDVVDEAIVTLAGYHASGLIKDKSLLEVIKAFFKKLGSYINQIFGTTLDVNNLNPNMTIRDLGLTLKDSIVDLSIVDLSPQKQLIGLLSSEESNKLVHLISSKVIERIKEKPTAQNLKPIIQSVIEKVRQDNNADKVYKENTALLPTNLERINYAKKRGKIGASLKLDVDIDYVTKQVIKDITSMYYDNTTKEKEDNEEDSVDEKREIKDEEAGIENSGGWLSLSPEVRSFIYFTTYSVKDEAGNIVETAVDPIKLYKTIQNILADVEAVDMFKTLETHSKYDTELEVFLNKLKNKVGYSSNGTLVRSIEQSNFLDKFFKNFENTKLEYIKTFLDSKTGTYKLNPANRDTNAGILTNKWKNKHLSKLKDISDIRSIIDTHLDTLSMYGTEEVGIKQVSEILESIGIDLQKSYLEYSLDPESKIAQLPSDVYKITITDITKLLKHLKEGNMIFKLSEDAEEGSTLDSYIRKYAEADMNFRTSLIEDSYRSSDGKLRNSYVKQNFLTKIIKRWKNKIQDSTDLIEALKTKDDSYYKYNYLFKYFDTKQIKELFNQMQLVLIGDVSDGRNNYTTKTLTSEAFWIMQKALYNNRVQSTINRNLSSFSYDKGEATKFAFVDYGKISDKNTEFALKVPINENFVNNKTFNEKGFTINKNETFFSNTYLDILYDTLFLQEYNKLKNYNSKEALKNYFLDDNGKKVIVNDKILAKIKEGNAFTTLSMFNNEIINLIEVIQDKEPITRTKAEVEIYKVFEGIDVKELRDLLSKENISEFKELIKRYMDRILTLNFKDLLISNAELSITNNIDTKTNVVTTEIENKDYVLNIANQYANNFILRSSIQQLVEVDVAVTKDLTDNTKRLARLLAYGESGESVKDNGSKPTYKVLYGQNDIVYKVLENNKFRDLNDVEQKLLDNKKEQEIVGLVKLDIDDAQAVITVKHLKETLSRLGKSNSEVSKILDKLDRGEKLTEEESNKIDLISMKGVHGDNENYLKMSESALTKDFTSVLKNGKWVARKGRESLHNLREFMERNDIGLYIPLSGSKVISAKKPISKNFFDDDKLDYSNLDVDVDSTRDLDWEWWREQQVNESGKKEITSPVQLNQLIDYSEHVTKNESDVIQELLIEQSEDDFRISQDVTTGNNVDYGKQVFLDKVEETAISSGADDLTVEWLGNENGDFLYSPNIPIVVNTFVKYFTSHFNKGTFSQKIPGYKCTLKSAKGLKVVRDTDTGLVIRSDVYEANPKKFSKVEATKLKIHQGDNPYAEVLMTQAEAKKLGLEIGDSITEDMFKMLGVRIPTQGYSSMIPFKVVDFLPEYYGSTIIAPEEIVFIAGSDYDVDSLFIMRKLAYRDKEGNLTYYSYNHENVTQRYNDYRHYLINHNKYVKSKISELKSKKEDREKDIDNILKGFGYPNSLESFKEAEKKNGKLLNSKAGVTNKLLTVYLDILTKPEMLTELHKPVDTAGLDDLGKYIHFELFKRDNPITKIHHSDTELQKSYVSASTGKRDVGAAASGSSIGAVLKRADTYLSVQNRFVIDGVEITGFEGNDLIDFDLKAEIESYKQELENKNKKQEDKKLIGKEIDNSIKKGKKQDLHIGLISITVDNQKDPVCGMLNLDITNTGIASTMVNTGLGKGYFSALFQYPVLTNIETIKESFQKLKEKAILSKDQKMIDYLDTLDIYNLYTFSDFLNKRTLVKGLVDKPGPLEQIAISLLYNNYVKINQSVLKLNKLISTTKTLGSTFEDIDNIYDAYEKLKKPTSALLNIDDILAKNPVVKYRLDKVKEIDNNVFSKTFITRTQYFKNTVLKYIEPSFYKNGVKTFEKNYVGYIIATYLNNRNPNLLKSKKDLANPTNDNNIVDKYINLMSNPEFAGNIIIQYLNTKVDKTTGASIFINQFLKLNSKSSIVFSDAFKELLNSENQEIKSFATDCFYHMIIKDNLNFTKETFSRLLPPKMLKDVSQKLNIVHNAILKQDDITLKDILGYTSKELISNYILTFGRYIKNINNIRTYTVDELKSTGLILNPININGKKSLSINLNKNTGEFIQSNNAPLFLTLGDSRNNISYELKKVKNGILYYDELEPIGVSWLSPYFQSLQDAREDYLNNITNESTEPVQSSQEDSYEAVNEVSSTVDNVEALEKNLKYNSEQTKPSEVIKSTQQQTTEVKPGVSELFESNPELANTVYEALGFPISNRFERVGKEIIRKEDGSTVDELNTEEEAVKALKEWQFIDLTSKQKQQAQQKFQEYINQTGKQDIEGFKQWNNKQQQADKLEGTQDVDFDSLPESRTQKIVKKDISKSIEQSSVENKDNNIKSIKSWLDTLSEEQKNKLRKKGFKTPIDLYNDFKQSGYKLKEYFDYLYKCQGL